MILIILVCLSMTAPGAMAGHASAQAPQEIKQPSTQDRSSAKDLATAGPDIVASRTFVQAVPANSTAVADVVDAFDRGLGQAAHDIAGWTLVNGDMHQRAGHKR